MQYFSFNLRSTWGVGGQFYVPAALPPGKNPVPIVQYVGWAPRPVWMGVKYLAHIRIRSPYRPARSESECLVMSVICRCVALHNPVDIQCNVKFTIYGVNRFRSHIHQQYYTAEYSVLKPLENSNVSGTQHVHPSTSTRCGLMKSVVCVNVRARYGP